MKVGAQTRFQLPATVAASAAGTRPYDCPSGLAGQPQLRAMGRVAAIALGAAPLAYATRGELQLHEGPLATVIGADDVAFADLVAVQVQPDRAEMRP